MIKNKLTEAIDVDGAEYIGNGWGYDLFEIRTWSAAQSFTVGDRDDLAGAAYTQNQRTFESHISPDGLKLYFFVRENTNDVYGAVLSTDGSVSIQSDLRGTSVQLSGNITFEDALDNSSTIKVRAKLPLYLIPGLSLNHCQGPLVINNDTLHAALPELTSEYQIDIDTTQLNIHHIHPAAFHYGLGVHSIILSSAIQEIPQGLLDHVEEIHVTDLERPTHWPADWDNNFRRRVDYGYGADPEAIERQRAEKEEQHRQEVQHQIQSAINWIRERLGNGIHDTSNDTKDMIEQCERFLRHLIEPEVLAGIPDEIKQMVSDARNTFDRLVREAEARKIRYKVVGNEITINGTRDDVEELVIPEEIEGKPVTKIAPYAFYDNENLVRITLPTNSLKEIGQGAFAECSSLRSTTIRLKPDCIIGKGATYQSNLKLVK